MIVLSAVLRNEKREALTIHNDTLNVQRRKDDKAVLTYSDCPYRRRRFRYNRQGPGFGPNRGQHEFVVAGKTLPAGTYRVVRLSMNNPRALILNSVETRASALVFATQVENSHDDKPKVSFEQVGDEYALSEVETANRLFKIPISRSKILEAAARSHNSTFAAESLGGTK